MTQHILFVCTGNICRSPLAEAVLRHYIRLAGRDKDIKVDSAGTHGYHIGERPDPRTLKIAALNNISTENILARQIEEDDFRRFDLILGMDKGHIVTMKRISPPEFHAKIHLFMDFAGMGQVDVPDPYYGGFEGFEQIFEMTDTGCQKFDLTLSKILCKL